MAVKLKFHPAWIMAIAALFMSFTGMGIAVNCMPLFVKEISEGLNISRAEFSAMFSIKSAVAMFSSIAFGHLIAKYASRHLITLSSLLVAGCFVCLATANNIWQIYIAGFLLGLGYSGLGLISPTYIITNWFEKYRGTMISIATASSAFAGAICVPPLQWIITNYGWRTSLMVMAAVTLILTLPFTLFILRVNPEQMNLTPYGAEEKSSENDSSEKKNIPGYTTREYFNLFSGKILFVYTIVVSLTFAGIKYHLPAYYSDLQYSPQTAATFFSVYMVALIIGRLLLGILSDKFGFKVNLGFLSVLLLGIVLLFFASSPQVAVISSACLGFSGGGGTVFVALVVVYVAGRKAFSTIFGIMNTAVSIGAISGPFFVGYLFDLSGSYQNAWKIIFGCAVLLVAIALFVISTAKSSSYQSKLEQ